MPSAQTALEALPLDPDLAQLECLLQRFNLFEAIGVLRQELRHSDLLATLLDPRQSHGLGTLFLTDLLRVAAPSADVPALQHARVEREWHNIDILVVDDTCRLVITIENKIDTAEHSSQLSRYYADVRSHFRDHAILALYLTPDGDAPSDNRYLAISYSQVCQIIERIVTKHQDTLDADVAVVLRHYAQMLRRHIVSDSDVARLCREIYYKHRQALDLILENRPDQQARIREYVVSLIKREGSSLILGSNGKNHIVFSLYEWRYSPRHGGPSGENICWMLFFCFSNEPNKLSLELQILPGDEYERQKHLKMAQDYHFAGVRTSIRKKYACISSVQFLRSNDYEKTQAEIEVLILKKWDDYLRDELPRIVNAVRDEKWLWELPG